MTGWRPPPVFVCTAEDMGAPKDPLKRWWWERNEPPAGIRRRHYPRRGWMWQVFCRVCGRPIRMRGNWPSALRATLDHLAWHARQATR
jgi:hypothetical protein